MEETTQEATNPTNDAKPAKETVAINAISSWCDRLPDDGARSRVVNYISSKYGNQANPA